MIRVSKEFSCVCCIDMRAKVLRVCEKGKGRGVR